MKAFSQLLSITLSITLLIVCTFYSLLVIAEENKTLKKTENIRDGAYLDIGVGIRHRSDPYQFVKDRNDSGLALYINGRYQKNGLFIEFPHGTSKQQSTVLSMGYNFLNTENWSYDLQLAMNHSELEHQLPMTKRVSRRISHSKLGLRVLADFDNTHVKFIVASSSGAKGVYASGWVSQNYQYYNWNFYASAGAEYRNEDVVNYFYAINEVEGLPYYRGKSGIEYTGQVGFDYPISEDWVFEGFVRTTLLPSGIADSPLVDGNTVTEAAVLVKYVF